MGKLFFQLKQKLATGDRDEQSADSIEAPGTSTKAFPSGIKVLHEVQDYIVDIVFVHGLTGDRERTWTADGASEPWPKSLLPSKIPNARVLTFGYDAYVADWRGVVSENRIANHAWNLLTSLARHRDDDVTAERPIIFVCHSLGGLVCEDALVMSRQRSERHLQSIFQSTSAILFLGTPHHGAGLARWAELFCKSLGLVKRTNPGILKVLKRDSEVLARIQDSFHTMVMARNKIGLKPIEISCFYEELPMPGVGLVVPHGSAVLPGYIPIGIRKNHKDMTKMINEKDPSFEAVCGELRRWIRDMLKSQERSTKFESLNEMKQPSATADDKLVNSPHADIQKSEIPDFDIGTISLPKLIGTFKHTIDLFGFVKESRRLGRQYEILDTMLDLERIALLQWAERVELLSTNYDRRLDDSNNQILIIRILATISSTISNTNNLQVPHQESEPHVASVPANMIAAGLPEELFTTALPSQGVTLSQLSDLAPSYMRLSQTRTDKFVKDFRSLQHRNGAQEGFKPSSQQSPWMISDKQQFEDLVQTLARLTWNLNNVVPPISKSPHATDVRIAEDLGIIKKDIDRLKIIFEASVGHHHSAAESSRQAIETIRQDRILNSLWFRKINERREDITSRHENTLKWIWDTPDGPGSWSNFSQWLRNGSGIYWVSGKAGSGKSTLMKYILLHQSTKQNLSEWAEGMASFTFNFFFSNLGSDEQKTQEGMARTLLYQILKENRPLIQTTLPNMWKEVLKSESASYEKTIDTAQDSIGLPSAAEVKFAFEMVGNHISTLGRTCFFIDGLDEFEGNYEEGIAFVKSLVQNQNIKAVISSRPIPICVAAFGSLPRLQLQDLTRTDIQSYTEDIIGGHPSMMKHMRRYPDECRSLLEEIVEKSCGVFLWVILACRSILNGFADHDRLPEIRRRVDELPPELEDMFMHMLGKISKRHRQQGAQLFKICHTCQTTWSPFVQRNLFALGLALIENYQSDPVTFQKFTNEDKVDLCEELEGRLRSRCGGLLEFAAGRRMPASQDRPEDEVASAQVVFMHRTVVEFLSNDHVWELDCLQTGSDCFNAATALSLYGVHMAKQMLDMNNDIQAMDHFEEGLWWGAQADRRRPGDSNNCFLHLDPFLKDLSGTETRSATLKRLSSAVLHAETKKCLPVALLLAVEASATNFVQNRLQMQGMPEKGHRSCGCHPVLFHALRKQFLSMKFRDQPLNGIYHSMEMVQLLLLSNCDGAELVKSDSQNDYFWSLWIDDILTLHDEILGLREKHDRVFGANDRTMFLNIAEAFLKIGVHTQLKTFELHSLTEFIQHVFTDEGAGQGEVKRAQLILDQLPTCTRVVPAAADPR